MANSYEFANVPGMTKEMREQLISTLDALSSWSDELKAVNERCLSKVLGQTSAVARSMGWPDQTINAAREQLENVSKMQTQVIDQIMDGWKRQLKSPTAPTGVPGIFANQMSRLSAGTIASSMPEFNPLAPWTFWWQAAEMWQRTWMPETPAGKHPRSH